MLTHIHVKNVALIDETEVDFAPGLNILTGETGAGKSILIDSVGMALGKKVSKDIIREGAEYALAELVFDFQQEEILQQLKTMDIEAEDGQVIVSRRVGNGRSVCKINGEIRTLSAVRAAAEILLDIHGQHEHQTLLYRNHQLEYLDTFGREEIFPLRQQVAEKYRSYKELNRELQQYTMNQEQRKREMDFLQYEIQEIEEAALTPGEDEELENRYRKMANSQKILETMGMIYEMTGGDSPSGAASAIGSALGAISRVVAYDDTLEEFDRELQDLDALLGDFNRELSAYLEDMTFSEEEFAELTERLDLVNHLKSKYGKTLEDVLAYAEKKRGELEKLQNYEVYRTRLEKQAGKAQKELKELCGRLTICRKNSAKIFTDKLIRHLADLNFADNRFEITFEQLQEPSAGGQDSIEFCISTNPGEPVRPLASVASGGELSRIMLAIRTLLAEQEHTETLIFDEIDTGISGRTAQKVSEKMALIAGATQVICITHLPQIAAMADAHYEIRKSVDGGVTHTAIRRLSREDSCTELARMLGGTQITESVMANASEMKSLADAYKEKTTVSEP